MKNLEAICQRHFGDSEILLQFQPEELGIRIISVLTEARLPMSSVRELSECLFGIESSGKGYSRNSRPKIENALIEAWSWLEAQGLLVWADLENGKNGWRRLSRRALGFESQLDAQNFLIARSLPRELLHPIIRERVWSDFIRGSFDSAALFAAKQVEVHVRKAANLGNDQYGTDLMRAAFNPKSGPLTDMAAMPAEREARSALFNGFIGSYKNPLSHRDVDLDDPSEVIELLVMASHLLRLVDRRIECSRDEQG